MHELSALSLGGCGNEFIL